MSKIYLMGIITNRSMRDTFQSFFEKHQLSVRFSTLGTGTASDSILDLLGMEATEKVIYLSFITEETWSQLKRDLYLSLHIDIPGRGIVFLIPPSSVGGKKVLQYLTAGQPIEIEEETTLKNTDYELLITIANAGYTDVIMDAARSAQAPGGTVIHAKGTGASQAQKFLGISLAEEKELILIVVRSSQKNSIMRIIMEETGIKSPAGSVCFSLPVTSVAGLRLSEEEF